MTRTIRDRRLGMRFSRQILEHYARKGLRGNALRSALERHARLLSPLDSQTASHLRGQHIGCVDPKPWFGKRLGAPRPEAA
jgi:hypothetical protein